MIREYLPYYRRNLKLAFPVMLTQLGATMVGFFDTLMVGHYSTTHLAAVSLSNAFFFTIMVLGMGVAMGLTPLVGQSYVQDERERVKSLFSSEFVLTGIVGLLSAVVLLCCIPLMSHIGQDPEVVQAAIPYFFCITMSIVPFVLYHVFKQFLEGIGNTVVAMVISVVCNLLNILLNYVFIFGHWGVEAMGATGAGLASLIARLVMFLAFVVIFLVKKNWREWLGGKVRWEIIREEWKVGLPVAIQTGIETIGFTLSFVIVGWIGKETLAAHQITNQVVDVTFMLAIGIGAATTIRVSHQYGLRDFKALKMAANASCHLCLVLNAIGAGVMIGLRNYIPMLFTDDVEVQRIASRLLIYAGTFQFADGLQCIGAAMLRGITDVRMPAIYAFVAYILVMLPVGCLLAFPLGLGVDGIWIGFVLGLCLIAVLFHVRFRKLYRYLLESEKKRNFAGDYDTI